MQPATNIINFPMAQPNQFEVFYKAFPRHVAPFAARRAFEKAIKLATLEQILSGIESYKKNKPPSQDWCYPATWLNAGRWLDEYDSNLIAKTTGADTVILGREYERVIARMKTLTDTYSGHQKWDDKDKAEIKRLRSRRDELRTILRITI